MKYLITKVEPLKTKEGKDMFKCVLKDEQGVDTTLNMFDKVGEGQMVEGDIVEVQKNGYTYKNFKSATPSPRQAAGSAFKTAQMERLQDRKSESIYKAQDRSAWMWAKNNASDILSRHPEGLKLPLGAIPGAIMSLATQIYLGEPTEPFLTPTEPSRSQVISHPKVTSPTHEFPDGISVDDHQFVTQADQEALDFTDIPF